MRGNIQSLRSRNTGRNCLIGSNIWQVLRHVAVFGWLDAASGHAMECDPVAEMTAGPTADSKKPPSMFTE